MKHEIQDSYIANRLIVIGVSGAGLSGMIASSIEISGVVLVAIPERYTEVSFGDFIQLDVLHELAESEFLKNSETGAKSVEHVSRLCAQLYRKNPTMTADKVEQEWWAKKWAREPPELLITLLHNYREMRHWLADRYPYLFQEGSGGKKTGASKTLDNWLAIRDAYCIEFGISADAANKTLLHDVLRFMNRKINKK